MTTYQTARYATDRPIAISGSHPEWTLCRNQRVFPVPDHATLERWTKQGRVRSDDYLVNHVLDVCVQAKDVAEIDAVFRKTRAQMLGRLWRALACVALGLLWAQPLFGTFILISAAGAALLALWTVRHRQNYRLSTAAESRHRKDGGHARVPTVMAA